MFSSETAADKLVLQALAQLDEAEAGSRSGIRARALARTLETMATARQADVLRRWSTQTAMSVATAPLEDELVSRDRALQHAHATIAAMQRQVMQLLKAR